MLRNFSIIFALLLCLAAGLPAQHKSAARAQTDDPAAQAEALLALSERQNFENHALARETAQQALALWQSLADNQGIARALAQVAVCYMAQSDLVEATHNYETALQIWRDLNNIREQARILVMLGFIEDRKGEWANSMALLTQAQNLIEGADEPFRMGQIASGFADIFSQNGLPETALVQYQRALDYYRQTPDTYDDALTVWAIGCTYYLMGNNSEALAHLQKALADLGPNTSDSGLCNEYLGRVYVSMGEFSTALPYLQSALDTFTRAVNPREAARVRGLIGQLEQQQGKLDLARQDYQQALAAFRKLADRINQAAIYYAMGRLELTAGNYNAAEDYLRQSIAATENIRQVPTSSDLMAAFSATVYERYETYIECLMRKHDAQPAQGLAVRAFETCELARGRSLAELLRATGTNLAPGLDPKLAEQEKLLRQSLRVKEDYRVTLLSQKAYKQEEFDALEAALARLESEYNQVNETIRARYPVYGQITQPVALDLQQIQEQVIADDETLLLEYSLGADKSYVWAVTRDGIKSYALPARASVSAAAQKAYKLLATLPDPDTIPQLDAALQELSRMVLSPVAAELNKRRIIIVADGELHYIPFQALPAPSNNERLVANYEIVNTLSASILGDLRKEAPRRQPTKVLAAFGDPAFGLDSAQGKGATGNEPSGPVQALELAPLQSALRDIELNGDTFDPSVIKELFYAKHELSYLRDAASDGETFIASGPAASRQQLLRTDLTQYAILHFATHGLLDPKHPENSGLLLSTVDGKGQAQDGFVGLQDIYSLRAPVDLVVLSACQTALGKEVRGEGLLGLTRGFMYAGASSVMASLWKVNDEATAELMRQTYTNMLKRGMTPAAALRAAQNSIRQRPEWQSPYYWAGFTLQGEYRQVIKPASAAGAAGLSRKLILIGSGALMVLAAAALWYRYRRQPRVRASR